jgi:hypothetical protein
LTMLAMVAHFAVASVKVIPIAGFGCVSGTTVAEGRKSGFLGVFDGAARHRKHRHDLAQAQRELRGSPEPLRQVFRGADAADRRPGLTRRRQAQLEPKAEVRVRTPFANARKLVSLRS